MPLDTSSYHLALLRLDGRRWNELRRLHAQISIQPSADGSSYLEMGNTKVLCTIAGPVEGKRVGAGGGGGGGSTGEAQVSVEIGVAGFSGTERKKWGRGDKRVTEMQMTIASAFSTHLFTHLYPHSSITISLHILSQDGALLAASLNAATLALVDAGVPMPDYLCAVTAGTTSAHGAADEAADPLLDLCLVEEQELPFLTVATPGEGERVSVCVLESRVQVGRVEGMLAVGVDGCKQVRAIMDGVVRRHGKMFLAGGQA